MKDDKNGNDWSFYDWFVLVFIILGAAAVISLFFSAPVPYWQW